MALKINFNTPKILESLGLPAIVIKEISDRISFYHENGVFYVFVDRKVSNQERMSFSVAMRISKGKEGFTEGQKEAYVGWIKAHIPGCRGLEKFVTSTQVNKIKNLEPVDFDKVCLMYHPVKVPGSMLPKNITPLYIASNNNIRVAAFITNVKGDWNCGVFIHGHITEKVREGLLWLLGEVVENKTGIDFYFHEPNLSKLRFILGGVLFILEACTVESDLDLDYLVC